MVRWGQTPFSDEGLERAASVFRPDLYEAATGDGAPEINPLTLPFDGKRFDPAAIETYLASASADDTQHNQLDA